MVLPGNVSRKAPSLYTPLASLQIDKTPERSLCTHMDPQFCNCCPEDTSRTPGLEASRDYDCRAKGLHMFIYFKSYCLRVWLSVILKLSAQLNSSPWNTHRSWHSFNNGNISRKSSGLDNHKCLKDNQELG